MKIVDEDTALAIATLEHPWFINLREMRMKLSPPRHPKEIWIKQRTAEIMMIGVTDWELGLLNNKV